MGGPRAAIPVAAAAASRSVASGTKHSTKVDARRFAPESSFKASRILHDIKHARHAGMSSTAAYDSWLKLSASFTTCYCHPQCPEQAQSHALRTCPSSGKNEHAPGLKTHAKDYWCRHLCMMCLANCRPQWRQCHFRTIHQALFQHATCPDHQKVSKDRRPSTVMMCHTPIFCFSMCFTSTLVVIEIRWCAGLHTSMLVAI